MGASEKARHDDDADIDFVLTEIGNFGRFQIFNYILIALPVALCACHIVTYVFTASPLDYRCANEILLVR